MEQHPEHTWGHTLPFGEEYYQKITELLRKIQVDAGVFAQVANKATEALRTGHKVYTDAAIGHMPPEEMADEREGNPAQIHCCGHGCSAEDYAALAAGDVLVTNSVNEAVRQVRDAGVYVVGLPTAYINNSTTPPGKVHPNQNDWLLEDVCTLVIDTYIPWNQGIVRVPQVPEMPLFPSSSNITCAIHWMLTAEVARSLATGEKADGTAGREYLDILLARLDDVHRVDLPGLNEQAVVVAKRIIAGGRFFVRSRNGGVQGDANGVAQGLMLTNAFEMRAAAEGGDGDTLVLAAVSADDPQELAWAQQGRANGNYIMGIGPVDSPQLRQACDVYFDNGCVEAAGVIEVPGMDEKICPATGILNNIILQILTAQFTDEMCRRGAVPYCWKGGYWVGGMDYNNVVGPSMRERGY
ncbi:MAG: hypothetical protein GKR89_13885 [Candidatus Latescibacteria bacterium]|nr:hypothetical protein [Candidatus Latescibacterota bacterium]